MTMTAMTIPDSWVAWIGHYTHFAITGVRSANVAQKVALHLARFQQFVIQRSGDDRVSTCIRRDVIAWQSALQQTGFAPATINNHLASLSACTTWIHAHAPQLFPLGDPVKGVAPRALGPLEPRALSTEQLQSLKSLCDRLPRVHQLTGRRWKGRDVAPLRAQSRPWRDRAIIFVLLSTGLRREELVCLDLEQVVPHTPLALRTVHRARINRVRGKGKTERTVFLSADARQALADYIEWERLKDGTPATAALFLSAHEVAARAADGRLSCRALNRILEQIGRCHDAEVRDPARHIAPLRPHDLRHTFAFHLAHVTGADSYELERRLGHRSQRYIQRYTNPPEAIAANYIEEF